MASEEASAQPTDTATLRWEEGEQEEGGDNAPIMPSFVQRGEEQEGRMEGRAIAERTQTSAHDDDAGGDGEGDEDDHAKERNLQFVTALSPAFAKRKAADLPITSTASATPTNAATLDAAAGTRHAVSFGRQLQHVPLHDKTDHFHGKREVFERKNLPRNTNSVAAAASVAGNASSISGRRTSPEVAAIPKPWTLINTIGARTSTAGASKKGNGVYIDSRTKAHHGTARRAAERETSIASRISRGSGGGVRRWALLNAETKAVKAFRREQTSAAAAAARLQVGKQRWGGLKAARNTTSIFMHALNVSSGYSDKETSSNSSKGEGQGHSDDRSRRRGRWREGAGLGGGESESGNSSSIWRESSDSGSDYSSSDNNSFNGEVGGWACL